jgi:hypothetical protein
MQIIQIHASKVRDVRESGFWNEPDEDVTEIILGAPISPIWEGIRGKETRQEYKCQSKYICYPLAR